MILRIESMATTLNFAKPHVLRNSDEYRAAVAEIDRLLERDPARRSAEYERLEFLSVLVEAYEAVHVPMPRNTTPRDVVDFMLEQRQMARVDLVPALGSRSRVSEFFSGKRRLSINQIKALQERLGIPADLLIG